MMGSVDETRLDAKQILARLVGRYGQAHGLYLFGEVCLLQTLGYDAFQKRHTVISTRLLSGRTLIHVYADRYPGDDFEPIHPTLEDVYFATIAGRHNDMAGNC